MGSPYRSGRSPDWLKMKNPDAPAVKREAEEDWTRMLVGYEGEMPPPEAFTTHGRPRHPPILGPFPTRAVAEAQPPGPCLVAKPAPPPTALVLHPDARDGHDRRAASMAFRSRGRNRQRG